ncbi:SDR family oxidoreductase [Duganella callida]|uniref:SDR family oxidoreductase n=1 Tax=Duganella callida TaxID=2561932 RepID=A0A4Y9RWI4_9BURK|nr:SDR family oxidoreductase [Duganella callida]TFW13647.1 SDR family oxidoreductase [Duganella callida]
MQKTILITGCSSGFGRSTAQLFARHGWNVVATMRDISAGADLARLPNVLVTPLDVQDPASAQAAIAAATDRFGTLDAVVNNAGFGLFGVFESTPPQKVREQFDVNVFGPMNVIRAALPQLRSQRAGVIVNVSSGAGVFTLPMVSLYCASKFALEGYSESLSYELAALGITVKIVEPGGVLDTGFSNRSGQEAGAQAEIADYRDFTRHTAAVFEQLRGQRLATSEDVARVIYQAVTDGSDQLRYLATEDIRSLVEARRNTSESDYITLMRQRYGFTGQR